MAKVVLAATIVALLAAVSAAGLMPGAPMDVDVESQGVKDALSFAMYQYNKGSNDMYASRPLKVLSAQRQLVNGYNYKIKVEIGRTNCRKPTTNPNNCMLHTEPDSKTMVCEFQVYTCPWESKTKLTSHQCS